MAKSKKGKKSILSKNSSSFFLPEDPGPYKPLRFGWRTLEKAEKKKLSALALQLHAERFFRLGLWQETTSEGRLDFHRQKEAQPCVDPRGFSGSFPFMEVKWLGIVSWKEAGAD